MNIHSIKFHKQKDVLRPAGGNQRSGTGKSELPGQWADVADSGDLTLEYGIYRKSHRYSEAKRDLIQLSSVPARIGTHQPEWGLRLEIQPLPHSR